MKINKTNTIISLTGSNPLSEPTMKHLRKNGVVIYIDVDKNEIINRCHKMKIDRVTFTGVDDNTNIKDLELISSQNPYVEWGILYSEKQQGQGGKYPSKKTILKVLVNDGALKKYNTISKNGKIGK